MNADRLLGHYERIADAPDAVPRLRRLILDLAVRGKLVEQDPNDVSPEQCFKATQMRLQNRAKRTRRLRRTPSTPITPEELPEQIPTGWLPARLNDTGLFINGLAFKPSDWKQAGLPIVRIQNLTDRSRGFNYASREFPDEVIVQNGDILVSWSATLDAFIWSGGKAVLNQHIFRVLPDEDLTAKSFLYLMLCHAIRDMADSEHAHGVAMTHINRGPFLAHVVFIPPVAEQHRIVAKVAELMALCDRLEAARAEREATRDRLTTASLAWLNAPDPDPATFREYAAFALDNLPRLTTRRDQIKALHQSILNLAVRGNLVPQDPNDEPASKLMKRIADDKSVFISRGRKRRALVDSLGKIDEPFIVPVTWRWARLGDIALEMRYGTAKKCDYNIEGTPVLRIPNVSGGKINLADMKFGVLTPREKKDLSLQCRDLLVVRSNGSLDLVGRAAEVGDKAEGMSFAGYLVRVRLSAVGMVSSYVWLVMNADHVRNQIEKPIRSAVGLKNVNSAELAALTIPLPPLAEQHRIVAKIDELMAICDRLEASLVKSDDTRRCLLDALLHEALQPTAESGGHRMTTPPGGVRPDLPFQRS